jgi:nucleoside-diphosphate-sugar epimerase
MNRVLVTGATGFIGSRLVNALLQNNSKVKILSRIKQYDLNTIVCDFENKLIPEGVCKDIDIVYHLAGFAHDLGDSSKLKRSYDNINVNSTTQLVNIAAKSAVKKFIFISSVKAGGQLNNKCTNEEDDNNPKGIYGKTKRIAELMVLKSGKESEMAVSIVRPSLVYGPNVKGNLKLMLSGVKRGWFPPLPEIGNKRSMIHVDDLVRAILLVAEDGRANGEIFIATDGAPYSSREIYNAMCGAIGKSIPKFSVPKKIFDLASLVSPRIKYKINKLLGDECYSSAKLEALGFKAKKTLKDMNETDF